MTNDEMLLRYLLKDVGHPVYYWTPINHVADEILGHDREFSPVDRDRRASMRVELSRVMEKLIAQGKVVRSRKHGSNVIRIHQAFAENRSLIH